MGELNIRPTTVESRKQIYMQTLLNKTDKVSKVSDNSVLNAHAYGVAKVSGKAEKDIVLAMSKLFPDLATGDQLDQVADNFGVSSRFGASESSTSVLVVGAVDTEYIAGVHTFESKSGIQFTLEESVTIGDEGFSYAKVRSVDVGEKTNVEPNTITKVSPEPTGHDYVVNEYYAQFGRDVETDSIFRARIKEGNNISANRTISMLEQIFMKINSNVLRVFYQGISNDGKLTLAIVTQNGIDLNQNELDALLDQGGQYFSLTELKPYGRNSQGIELKNIEWQYIDVSFRAETRQDISIDTIRKDIQIAIAKYMDFRYWQPGAQKVEWDELLQIVKNVRGVKNVPDQFFYPNNDVATYRNKLPRLRGFRMLNLDGAIVIDLQGGVNAEFYPNVADFSLQQTVLTTI